MYTEILYRFVVVADKFLMSELKRELSTTFISAASVSGPDKGGRLMWLDLDNVWRRKIVEVRHLTINLIGRFEPLTQGIRLEWRTRFLLRGTLYNGTPPTHVYVNWMQCSLQDCVELFTK